MGVCINNIIEKIVPGDWGKEDTDNSGVRVIRTTNFTNVGKIDFSNIVTRIITDKKIRERQLIKGDIIIEKSGGSPNQPVGRVVYFDEDDNGEPILCNNFTSVIRCKSDVNSRYIFYYLYLNWCKGGTRKYQNKTTGILNLKLEKYLDDIVIELPTLEEQNRIVSLLDKADEIRAKKKLANDKLDEFLKSTFISMFGDPVRNEKNLPMVKFSDMGTLARGKSKHRPRNAPELLGGEYPLIQTGDVANAGLYLRKYTQTYSKLGLKQSKMWEAGTLCITIAANIAKTAIMTFDACFPDSVVGFINNEKCNIQYIQFWLMFLQAVLEAEAPQSAQKNINLEILNGLSLPYPPIEDQNKFAKIVEKVESQKQKNELVIEQMNNLFNSLSQRAFKGELGT